MAHNDASIEIEKILQDAFGAKAEIVYIQPDSKGKQSKIKFAYRPNRATVTSPDMVALDRRKTNESHKAIVSTLLNMKGYSSDCDGLKSVPFQTDEEYPGVAFWVTFWPSEKKDGEMRVIIELQWHKSES